MRCFVQTHLNATAESVWAAVKRPATLLHITRGFLGFSGADRLPTEWSVNVVFHTRFWFFHILPAWWQHTLAVKQVDEAQRVIASHEHGGLIRVWDHTIRVSPAPSGCEYSDEIEIHAGLFTALIWLYANIFYRYRQARWRGLAQTLARATFNTAA